jgi:hypothetical protein
MIKRSSSSKIVVSGVDLRDVPSTLEELKTRYSLKWKFIEKRKPFSKRLRKVLTRKIKKKLESRKLN